MTSVKNKYTDDEIKETYYNDYIDKHLSIRSLEKIYNYNFRHDFKRLGLPIRNDQEKNRKYSCNEEYFKEINTEEKAYWLGFIMADGYISKNKNSSVKKFGISIKESDAEHLEKLRNAINADAPVLHYTVTQGYKVGIGYCRITISNNTFAQYLIEHGCVEHKSNILKPPIGVPEELIHHFIRGFMDGNGSITQNNTKYGYSFSIKWVSTDEILNWIMDYLINQGILTHKYPLNKRKKNK